MPNGVWGDTAVMVPWGLYLAVWYWLDPRAPQNDSSRGATDDTFVADCFLIASTQIAVEVAEKLTKPIDPSRFRDTALRLVHALGSIANWMHADIGGLEVIEPGWKVFRVRPQPNKELSWADTVFESRYGRIELTWTLKGDLFCMRLRVPPNSTAVVSLPSDEKWEEYDLGCQFVATQGTVTTVEKGRQSSR
ncbi:bacterial alpha-L-rhamnosidase domain-containing protein [Trichoderma austrokoningii]